MVLPVTPQIENSAKVVNEILTTEARFRFQIAKLVNAADAAIIKQATVLCDPNTDLHGELSIDKLIDKKLKDKLPEDEKIKWTQLKKLREYLVPYRNIMNNPLESVKTNSLRDLEADIKAMVRIYSADRVFHGALNDGIVNTDDFIKFTSQEDCKDLKAKINDEFSRMGTYDTHDKINNIDNSIIILAQRAARYVILFAELAKKLEKDDPNLTDLINLAKNQQQMFHEICSAADNEANRQVNINTATIDFAKQLTANLMATSNKLFKLDLLKIMTTTSSDKKLKDTINNRLKNVDSFMDANAKSNFENLSQLIKQLKDDCKKHPLFKNINKNPSTFNSREKPLHAMYLELLRCEALINQKQKELVPQASQATYSSSAHALAVMSAASGTLASTPRARDVERIEPASEAISKPTSPAITPTSIPSTPRSSTDSSDHEPKGRRPGK